jgi:hypothetical protein
MTPESQSKRSLLGNDLANRFPWQQIRKKKSRYYLAIMMETVFPAGSAPRLYNGDPRSAEEIIEGVS